MGELGKAIADLTRALSIDPKYAFAYELRGLYYQQRGDYAESVRDCTEALRLDPRLSRVYKARAEACRKLGEDKLAEEDEKRDRELNGNQP